MGGLLEILEDVAYADVYQIALAMQSAGEPLSANSSRVILLCYPRRPANREASRRCLKRGVSPVRYDDQTAQDLPAARGADMPPR